MGKQPETRSQIHFSSLWKRQYTIVLKTRFCSRHNSSCIFSDVSTYLCVNRHWIGPYWKAKQVSMVFSVIHSHKMNCSAIISTSQGQALYLVSADTELVHRACSRAHWCWQDFSQYFQWTLDRGSWLCLCFASGHFEQKAFIAELAIVSLNTNNVMDIHQGEEKHKVSALLLWLAGEDRRLQWAKAAVLPCSPVFH